MSEARRVPPEGGEEEEGEGEGEEREEGEAFPLRSFSAPAFASCPGSNRLVASAELSSDEMGDSISMETEKPRWRIGIT